MRWRKCRLLTPKYPHLISWRKKKSCRLLNKFGVSTSWITLPLLNIKSPSSPWITSTSSWSTLKRETYWRYLLQYPDHWREEAKVKALLRRWSLVDVWWSHQRSQVPSWEKHCPQRSQAVKYLPYCLQQTQNRRPWYGQDHVPGQSPHFYQSRYSDLFCARNDKKPALLFLSGYLGFGLCLLLFGCSLASISIGLSLNSRLLCDWQGSETYQGAVQCLTNQFHQLLPWKGFKHQTKHFLTRDKIKKQEPGIKPIQQ